MRHKMDQTEIPATGVEPARVRFERLCTVTCEPYVVTVPKRAYLAWRDSTLAQDAFPELSVDQREFLISGLTPCEFTRLYGVDLQKKD